MYKFHILFTTLMCPVLYVNVDIKSIPDFSFVLYTFIYQIISDNRSTQVNSSSKTSSYRPTSVNIGQQRSTLIKNDQQQTTIYYLPVAVPLTINHNSTNHQQKHHCIFYYIHIDRTFNLSYYLYIKMGESDGTNITSINNMSK